jgi:ferredoxin-NADP reductase
MARVISLTELVPNTFILRTERTSESLIAGQCFSIGTRDLAINREYSIYSGAHEDYFEFLIRRVEGGAVSQALCSLTPNTYVDVWGPYGKFIINEDRIDSQKFVFISTGTGIAPFNSFVNSFPTLDYILLHGVRTDDEVHPDSSFKPETYFACVSQSKNEKRRLRVTNMLQRLEFSENQTFYLCGNQSMISESIAILRQRGVNGDRIFIETFF